MSLQTNEPINDVTSSVAQTRWLKHKTNFLHVNRSLLLSWLTFLRTSAQVIGTSAECGCFKRKLITLIVSARTVLLYFTGTCDQVICLLTASDETTLKLWNTENGRGVETLVGPTDLIFTAEYNYMGNLVCAASKDNTVRMWQAQRTRSRNTR